MVSVMPVEPSPGFFTIIRFRPADDVAFLAALREAVAVLVGCVGCVDARITRAVDDGHLILLIVGWDNVGSYRRALSSYDVKVAVVPLLAQAVDEATAFEVLHQRDASGVRDAVSARAADADTVSLGDAAAGYVPPAAS